MLEFTDDQAPARPDDKPQPYTHQPWPSWRYHRSGASMLVYNDDESDALKADPDWSHTPATFFPHSAPSRAQIEEQKQRERETARQAALAAARQKAAQQPQAQAPAASQARRAGRNAQNEGNE